MSEERALVNYEEQLRKELATLKDSVEPPSSNKIGTKGKVFSTPDGKSGPGPLSLIILDFIGMNQYYPGAYNQNQKVPPACWSLGRNLKEMTPSANVPKPQNVDCDTCPRNQWNSGPNGKGKACKNQRRLLVLPTDFTSETEPLTLYVSPTGLKAWNRYVDKDLGSDMGIMPVQAITEVSFDPNQSYPTLQFKFLSKHARLNEAMAIRQKYQDILWREPELKDKAA
jgi:hypothetical protein